MENEITVEDIRKEFPDATPEQVDLILIWISEAYSNGYDKGADAQFYGQQ